MSRKYAKKLIKKYNQYSVDEDTIQDIDLILRLTPKRINPNEMLKEFPVFIHAFEHAWGMLDSVTEEEKELSEILFGRHNEILNFKKR